MAFTIDKHAKKKTKQKNSLFDVGNIDVGAISTNFFFGSVIVACDMVSFSVKFQSDIIALILGEFQRAEF